MGEVEKAMNEAMTELKAKLEGEKVEPTPADNPADNPADDDEDKRKLFVGGLAQVRFEIRKNLIFSFRMPGILISRSTLVIKIYDHFLCELFLCVLYRPVW